MQTLMCNCTKQYSTTLHFYSDHTLHSTPLFKSFCKWSQTFNNLTFTAPIWHDWKYTIIPSRCWFLSWLVGVQVWPLPEVTAGLEWTCRQIQQHGRTSCLCRESGLCPGHQVLLQRPRREGIPHVSTFHICMHLHLNNCCRYEANSPHPKKKKKTAIASLLIDRAVTRWPAFS